MKNDHVLRGSICALLGGISWGFSGRRSQRHDCKRNEQSESNWFGHNVKSERCNANIYLILSHKNFYRKFCDETTSVYWGNHNFDGLNNELQHFLIKL